MRGRSQRQRSTGGNIHGARNQTRLSRGWSVIAMFMIALMPVITGYTQDASPEPLPQTRSTVVVEVMAEGTSSDDTHGVELCLTFTNPAGEAEQLCQEWHGTPLTFDLPVNTQVRWQALTDNQPLMQPSEGEFTTPAEGRMELRVDLLRTPEAELTEPLTDSVEVPDQASPSARSSARVAPEASLSVMQAADAPLATVTMNLIEPDGQSTFPQDATVCVQAVTGNGDCFDISAGTLTGQLPPDTYNYYVHLSSSSQYGDARGVFTVEPGGTLTVNVPLQPRQPGDLAVDILVPDSAQPPAGTVVCVALYTDTLGDEICQTYDGNVNGEVIFSRLQDGHYAVKVTPPEDSIYLPAESSAYVDPGETKYLPVELSRKPTSTVNITVSTPDDGEVPQYTYVCVWFDLTEEQCLWRNQATANDDGSYTYSFEGIHGSYRWRVIPQEEQYYGDQGERELEEGEEDSFGVVLNPYTDGTGTMVLTVRMEDGSVLPPETVVCYNSSRGKSECQSIGDPGTSSSVITFTDVPEGFVELYAPEYLNQASVSVPNTGFVEADETVAPTLVLRRIAPESFSKTVDASQHYPGERVTFTIQGQFQGSNFRVFDQLPAGFQFESASCFGNYHPTLGGNCYRLDSRGVLEVLGASNSSTGSGTYAIVITGVITGNPGDVITNTACTHVNTGGGGGSYSWPNDELASRGNVGVARMMQGGTTTYTRCAAASTTVVDPPPAAFTFTKTLQSVNDGPASLSVLEGDVLEYRLTITNVGSLPVTGASIRDDRIDGLVCDFESTDSIAPGASVSCTGTHTVDSVDAARGTFLNVATARVSDADPKTSSVVVVVRVPIEFEMHTVQPVCGPNNDVLTINTSDPNVRVVTTDWQDGWRTVSYTVPNDFYLVDDDGEEVTELIFQLNDEAEPCPPGVTPTPGETATPTPGETATPTPSETATPTATASVTPTAPETGTAEPTASPDPVTGLPSTGVSSGSDLPLYASLITLAGALGVASVMRVRSRRAA